MRCLALCALALCLSGSPRAAAASCADLSLVLAIDSSGSIDGGEYALQTLGYAAAFQSSGVKRAIASAGVVDVAVVYWADSDFASQIIPWHRISSPQRADAFAASILAAPRLLTGDTDLGNGLALAIDMLEQPGRCSIRRIVNVSGDGRESSSPKRRSRIPLTVARRRATEIGIVVNALAIANEDEGLADYYSRELITGPAAFVLVASDFSTFGEAIKLKLEREIGLSLSSSRFNDSSLTSSRRW